MPKPPDIDKIEALDEGWIQLFYGEPDELANVTKSPIIYKGIRYMSGEQAYQAQKFDWENADAQIVFQMILNTKESGKSKEIAGEHSDLIRPDWCDVRFRIMCEIVFEKFRQNPDFSDVLLATNDRYLVEDAPADVRWGMVTDDDDIMSGHNYMGRVLMFTRWRLQRLLNSEI